MCDLSSVYDADDVRNDSVFEQNRYILYLEESLREMWSFVIDENGDLGDGNKSIVDMTSPHIYPLAWGPSNQCLTCFKRGNAATSICSDRALGPNQSCVVYFEIDIVNRVSRSEL